MAIAATVALGATVELMLGAKADWRAGPFRIRISDVNRTLVIAGALSASLVLAAWRLAWLRRYAMLAFGTACLLAVIAIARGARDIAGAGDIAVIESYTFDVLHSRLLVGPYSRFEWHHPGPLYFYLLAPFYALSGSKASGLAAGVLVLNFLSLTAMGWVSLRVGGPLLGILVSGAGTSYIVRAHALLASGWNAHAIVLPTMASIVLAAAAGAGQVYVLPLLAVFVSLTAQTHVGVVPVVFSLCCAAVGMATLRRIGTRDASGWRRLRRALNGSAWICVLLWAVPVIEQFARPPGNLTKLWLFFGSDQPRPPLSSATGVWAGEVAGWLRPTFSVALGLSERNAPPTALTLLVMVAVLSMVPLAHVARRRGREVSASLAVTVFTSAATALWSTTRISGGVFDHQVFWMSCIGPLVAVVLVDAAIDRWRSGWARIRWPAQTVVLGAFALVISGYGYAALKQVVDHSYRPLASELAAQTIADETEKHVREAGEPVLIIFDQAAWEVAAGAVVQLQKRRVPFAIETAMTWMFTDALAPTGKEKEAVIISTEDRHLELRQKHGAATIAARRGYFADVVPLRAGQARFSSTP